MSDAERIWKPAELILRYQAGDRRFGGLDIDDVEDPASFRDAVLDGADFTGCFIVADFTRASLRGAKFVEANVKTCRFDAADLRGCDFSGAALESTSFEAARLDGAEFAGAGNHSHVMKPGELPDW